MGWLDNIKNFVTNVGSVVSGYASSIASDFKEEWSNQSKVGEEKYAKAQESVRSSKTNVEGPSWFESVVEKLSVSKNIWEDEKTLQEDDLERASARIAVNAPKNLGAVIQIALQSQRYNPVNIFLTQEQREKNSQLEISATQKIVDPLFDVTDYLTERNRGYLYKKPTTYNERESLLSRPALVVNPEYMRKTIADAVPSIMAYMAAGGIGKAGTAIPRISQVFVSLLQESPYAQELDRLREEGKNIEDATFKQWAWGAVNTGIVTALEQIGNQAAFDVNPSISTIEKKAFEASQLQAKKIAQSRLYKAMPYVVRFFKDTMKRGFDESVTEFHQSVIPELSHLFLLEGDLTDEQLNDRLTDIAYGGLQGASSGFLSAMPFSSISEFIETRADYRGDIIFNETLGDDQEAYLIRMSDNDLIGPDGYFRDGLLAGRVADINQKLQSLGIYLEKGDGVIDTLSKDIIDLYQRNAQKEPEDFTTFEKNLIGKKYNTYAEFAQSARLELQSALSNVGFRPEGAAYVAEKLVGKDEFLALKIEDKNTINSIIEINTGIDLPTSLPDDSEETQVYDAVRYSNNEITNLSDAVATATAQEVAQNTAADLAPELPKEVQSVNSSIADDSSDRAAQRETYAVTNSQQPIEREVDFVRTSDGFDVVNAYEYVDGYRYMTQTDQLQTLQGRFGTTDRATIARMFVGGDSAVQGSLDTTRNQTITTTDTQRTGLQQQLARYQQLQSETTGITQRAIIRRKIASIQRQITSLDGADIERGFITSEEALKQVAAIPFMQNITVVEVQALFTQIGKKAYGSYAQAIVQFVKDPHNTTLPHEAFHAFADLVLTQTEKENALNIIKNRDNITDDVKAEEIMAQEFANYFVAVEKPTTKLAQIFMRIKQLMLEFVGAVPELEKIFNQVTSPFIVEDVGRIMQTRKALPELRRSYQADFVQNVLRLFDMPQMSRGTVSQVVLRDIINSPKSGIRSGEKYVLLSVLDSEEFKSQDRINVNDYKRAVSDEMLDINVFKKQLHTTRFRKLGIDPQNAGEYIINTNYLHGDINQLHFQNGFTTSITKDDLAIQKLEQGTYMVDGEYQSIVTPMYGVMENDVKTKDDIDTYGVISVFDTQEKAQQFINNFDYRVKPRPGVFGHIGAAVEGDRFVVGELQADPYQHNMDSYIRSDARLKDLHKRRYIDPLYNSLDRIKNIESIIATAHDVFTRALDLLRAAKDGSNMTEAFDLIKKELPEIYYSVRDYDFAFPSDTNNSVAIEGISAQYNDAINYYNQILSQKEMMIDRYQKDIEREEAEYVERFSKEGAFYRGKKELFRINAMQFIDDIKAIIDNGRPDRRSGYKLEEIYYPTTMSSYPINVDVRLLNVLNNIYKYISKKEGFDQLTTQEGEKIGEYAQKAFVNSMTAEQLSKYFPYIQKKADEIANEGYIDAEKLETSRSEQFLSFKNNYHELLVKQAIRIAAQNDAKTIEIPAPYTLAVIEGFEMIGNTNPQNFSVDRLVIDAHKKVISSYEQKALSFFKKIRKDAELINADTLPMYASVIIPNDKADFYRFQETSLVEDTPQPQVNQRLIGDQLLLSRKGAKIAKEVEDIASQNKAYPEWVPKHLRDRRYFKAVSDMLIDGRRPAHAAIRQSELYDIIHNQMRVANGMSETIFSDDVPNDAGVIINPTGKLQSANVDLDVDEQRQLVKIFSAVRAFAYDAASAFTNGANLTAERFAMLTQKIAEDMAIDTKNVISKRETQLMKTSLLQLQMNKDRISEEYNALLDSFVQRIKYAEKTFAPGVTTLAPYLKFKRKHKRNATEEEIVRMAKELAREESIASDDPRSARLLELDHAITVIDRLISIYQKDVAEGRNRAAKYVDLTNRRTELRRVISLMKKHVNEDPRVLRAKADIVLAKSTEDPAIANAFGHLTNQQRIAYNTSTQDFVSIMKDTYLMEKVTDGKSRFEFVDGATVDNKRSQGYEIVYSMTDKGQEVTQQMKGDEYLTILTNNHKGIQDLVARKDALMNELLLGTNEYPETVTMLNDTENKMRVIESMYSNPVELVRAVRAFDLREMTQTTKMNQREQERINKAQKKKELDEAKREGKENAEALQRQFDFEFAKAQVKKRERNAILKAWRDTYKFITTEDINNIISQYAKYVGEETNLYTMSDARFENIIETKLMPILEHATEVYVRGQMIRQLIEEKEIQEFQNIEKAFDIKYVPRIKEPFEEMSSKYLKSNIKQLDEYIRTLNTLEVGTRVLEATTLEKFTRWQRNNPNFTIDEANTVFSEKELTQWIARESGISYRSAELQMQWLRENGYNMINRRMGLGHVSEKDIYTQHIAKIMMTINHQQRSETDKEIPMISKRLRSAVRSRTMNPFALKKKMTTYKLIADYLNAQTVEERAQVGIGMTQAETDTALWIKNTFFGNKAKILTSVGVLNKKENYLTWKQQVMRDYIFAHGYFKGTWKYFTRDKNENAGIKSANKDVLQTLIMDKMTKNGHVSSHDLFKYSLERFTEEQGSIDLERILRSYAHEFHGFVAMTEYLPTASALIDVITMNSKKAVNISTFWQDRINLLKGVKESFFKIKQGGFIDTSLSGFRLFLTVKFLGFNYARHFLSGISEIAAIAINQGFRKTAKASWEQFVVYNSVRLSDYVRNTYLKYIVGSDKVTKESASFYTQRSHTQQQVDNINRIFRDNPGIIGIGVWDDIRHFQIGMMDKTIAFSMIGFGFTMAEINRMHITNLLTQDEKNTGVLSPERVSEIAIEMTKSSYLNGLSESPIGASPEAQMFNHLAKWTLPGMMDSTNTLANSWKRIADVVRVMTGKERIFEQKTGRKLMKEYVSVARAVLLLSSAMLAMQGFLLAMLPDDDEDDTFTQRNIKDSFKEIMSKLSGHISYASKLYLLLRYTALTLSGEKDSGGNEPTGFIDEYFKNEWNETLEMFVAYGETGVPAVDSLIALTTGVFVNFLKSQGWQLEDNPKRIFNKEIVQRFDVDQQQAKQDMMDALFKFINPGFFKTMERLMPASDIVVKVNDVLSKKKTERDYSEELLGHRFGLDEYSKEAARIYEDSKDLTKKEQIDMVNALDQSQSKRTRDIAYELRKMFAGKDLTEQERKIMYGVTRYSLDSVDNAKQNNQSRAYLLHYYTKNLTKDERNAFVKNVMFKYGEYGLLENEVFTSYKLLRDKKVELTKREVNLYDADNYTDDRARAIVELIKDKKANDKEAKKMVWTYLNTGIIDQNTWQRLPLYMHEAGYTFLDQ